MKVFFSLAALLIAVGLCLFFAKTGNKQSKVGLFAAKNPLTKNEQPMYFRLVEALPEYIVLAQVAFSAVLKASDRATRNRFDRKVADFVVCTKSFDVVAIIELDDASHKGKELEDAKRDSILTTAGYKVKRYKRTPDIDDLRRDFPDGFKQKSA